jgi:3-methyl-2-oxobutanoate hydroxymethyltransferase
MSTISPTGGSNRLLARPTASADDLSWRQPVRGGDQKGTAMIETQWPTDRRITIRDLQAATDRGERWAMLTSYDTLTAGVFERAGVRAILVGDTSGELVLGYPDTVPVTMEHLIPMVQAVVRGTRTVLVVADLPFGSYQGGPVQALTNAVRHLEEGGAQAVKLEGGRAVLRQVRLLVEAGERLLEDALALQAAGAFAVVLESVPAELGARVSAALRIPTVGIGAGAQCDAQIMVWQDLAGLTTGHAPKVVKRFADLAATLDTAVRQYVSEVVENSYSDDQHSYV